MVKFILLFALVLDDIVGCAILVGSEQSPADLELIQLPFGAAKVVVHNGQSFPLWVLQVSSLHQFVRVSDLSRLRLHHGYKFALGADDVELIATLAELAIEAILVLLAVGDVEEAIGLVQVHVRWALGAF